MVVWTIILFLIATVSGIFAFGEISTVFQVPAKLVFFIFAPLFLIFLGGLKREKEHAHRPAVTKL